MPTVRRSTVTGFKEAKQVLDQLPANVQKRVVQKAVNAGMRFLLKAVKSAAPRGEKPSKKSAQYGSIFKNLRVETLKKVKKGSKGARITTRNAFWGLYYEIGTKHQPARPFLRPAIDENADQAFAAVRDTLGSGIEQEATKLANSVGALK